METTKTKKIVSIVLYAAGIILGLCIIVFGWQVANNPYPSYSTTSAYQIDRDVANPAMGEVNNYAFGADYYTDTYNAFYTINENIGVFLNSNSQNFQKVLNAQQQTVRQIAELSDAVNQANVDIKQENTRNWGVLLLIIGALIILLYVEKIIKLFSFSIPHRPLSVESSISHADNENMR